MSDFNLTESYQKGEISCDEFLDSIVLHSNDKLNQESARTLWNKILIQEKFDTIDIIKKLKKHYNLAIFSNTNQIHCEYMYANYSFFGEFEKIYLSHEVGLIKPDPTVFSFMQDDLNTRAEECVFIDDTMPNVEAAINAGWQAIHFKDVRDLNSLLELTEKVK